MKEGRVASGQTRYKVRSGLWSIMASADRLYRRLLANSRFFSKGWGPVDTYEKLLDFRDVLFSREGCADILRKHPQKIRVKKAKRIREGLIYDGEFFSPLAAFLPGLLPKESEMARFEMVVPHSWTGPDRPMYIHLAGTGDHYFWRRRFMTVLPTLAAANIGAVSLENPFYGSRKPPEQTRSQVQHVSDLFVMGMALILECMVIMHWLEEKGLGPVGLTGFSMGGHNCSLAAALWPKAVAVVPCLSWSTASSSFTEGLLSKTVCWDVLEAQLVQCRTNRDERRRQCFRRIRDLEMSTQHTAQNPHLGHSESETYLDPSLGNSALLTFAEGSTEGHLPSNSVLRKPNPDMSTVRRGFEQSLGRSSVVTASLSGLPHLLQQAMVEVGRSALNRVTASRRREVKGTRRLPFKPQLLENMRMVLDSATHHQHFPVPLDTSLAHFVAAEKDAYIPRHNLTDVRSLWHGCEVECIRGGHISSTVLRQSTVHRALEGTMHKAITHQYL